MRTFLTKAAATLLAWCLMWPQGLAFAAAPAGGQGELDALLKSSKPKVVVFDGIEVSDDRITMKLSGTAKHQTQLLSDPPRILVDLYGTDYQVGVKVIPGKGSRIKGVRGNQYKGAPDMVSRIVVDLSEAMPYSVGHDGNNLVVLLVADGEAPAGEKQAPAAVEAKAEPVKAAVEAKAEPAKSEAAKTVAVKTVAVKTEAPKAAAVKTEDAKAVAVPAEKKAEAPKAAVAAAKPVEAAAEVKDAPAAPARPTVVVPKPQPKKAVVVAQMPPMSLPLAGQPAAPSAERDAPVSAGARCKAQQGADLLSRLPCDLVDLDFDNTPLKDILALLSAKTKINIISGPEVAGNLTLHLKGVPFDEAFRTIMTMAGLTTLQVGDNILRVLTPASMTAAQASATNMTKVITLRYSKAAELLPALSGVRAAEGRKGSAIVDEKSNSLILTDSMEGMASMERLIARLDEIPKQVLIETKIVEVNLNNRVDFGIKWDIYKTQTGEFLGQQGLTTIGSRLGQTETLTSQSIVHDNVDQGGEAAGWARHNATPQRQPGDGGLGTGVDLLPGGALGMLTIGRVTNNYFLNMQVGALAQQGRLKVLSDPKIATLNNKTAVINVTDQIPYDVSTLSANGTVSRNIAFIAMGITLSVTPIISADESRITLDINPEVSNPSGSSGSVSGAPSTSRKSVKTMVIVKDGETVVIGGLITDRKDTNINKIPILGDIPVLGWLFKKKFESRTRVELLIFVTPRVIKDS
ncbi:MAG: type IV pilus secretin PilQ [Elusimicrobia bacterium]|nr:type IV pilus secretin PilQ [Elusimicrobiota bacterium]